MFARGLMAGVFWGLIILLMFVVGMFIVVTFTKTSTTHLTDPAKVHVTIDSSLPILLPECARNLTGALATHLDFQVIGDVGNRPVQGRVLAMNDILCEEHERMANLAIIATIESGTHYYARSHFHFLDNGGLVSTYTEQWERIHSPHEWKVDWCEFIRLVYPKELAIQKCVSASK